MSSVRITQLPELPQVTTSNASNVFIPVVVGGVTRKVNISSLLQYRTNGTVSSIQGGSSIRVAPSSNGSRASINFFLPGAVTQFAGSQIPIGFLPCYGQAVSRATYVDLFSVIGVTYGLGDNRSTFNLPDLRGRVPFGSDAMELAPANRLTLARPGGCAGALSSVGGLETHTLTLGETPICPHTHRVTTSWDYTYNRGEGGNKCSAGYSYNSILNTAKNVAAPVSYSLDVGVNSNTSEATKHINVPPLVFLNYVIKY